MVKGKLFRRKMSYLISLVFFTLLLAGCGGSGQKPGEKTSVQPVALARADTGSVTQQVKVTGTLAASSEVNIVPEIPGKVAEMLVEVGDQVKIGQPLLKLDSADLEARARQAGAALETARANLAGAPARLEQARQASKQARDALNIAKVNLDRLKLLSEQGGISRQQLESGQLAFDQAEAALETAKQGVSLAESGQEASQAQLAQAQAALEQARLALAHAVLTAPISGEVAARMVGRGEMAQGPVLTLVALDTLNVELGLGEADINFVQPRQGVEVRVPAAGNEPLSGKIASVSPALDSRSRSFRVMVELPNPGHRLKPGMTATVLLAGAKAKDVIIVPKQAVLNRGGQQVIFTVHDGKAASRVVKTGLSDSEKVAITSGLTAGEEIVVSGQDYLQDGVPVQVKAGGNS